MTHHATPPPEDRPPPGAFCGRQLFFTGKKSVWRFLLILAVGLAGGACTDGQPPVPRVGILCGLDVFASTADGFKARMTELGYVEGRTIVYDHQKTNFDAAAEARGGGPRN